MVLAQKEKVKQLELREEHIQIGVKAKDWEEAIRKACQPLIEDGTVEPAYAQDAVDREKIWATGLRVMPQGVAIPHGEVTGNINRSSIGVAVLKEAVTFREAGTEDGDIEIKIVFLLAIKDSMSQLDVLRTLMNALGNEEQLDKLQHAKSAEEFIQLFHSAQQE